MNAAMVLVFFIIAIGLGLAFVAIYGTYVKTKLTVTRQETEIDRLRNAISISQGYLENVSTSQIPGVSDGAYTTLARIDALVQEKENK